MGERGQGFCFCLFRGEGGGEKKEEEEGQRTEVVIILGGGRRKRAFGCGWCEDFPCGRTEICGG